MPEKDADIIDVLKDLNLKLSLILGEIIKSKTDSFIAKDGIKYLYDLGLDSKNISQVLGITTARASQEISRLKKGKKGAKNGNKEITD